MNIKVIFIIIGTIALVILSSCNKEIEKTPIASFSISNSNIRLGENVFFTDKSTNKPTSWTWNFGDGETSTKQNPSHVYKLVGEYSVSLVVSNASGSDSKNISNCIIVKSNIVVTDIDGNEYNTVQIGTQLWMAENIKVTHYPNGDIIPNVTDNTTWANLDDNNTEDAYCFYYNDNITDYGTLYTYSAAIADNWIKDNADNQGICPDGWHVPTNDEWTILIDYLGGESVAGGKMKIEGTTYWNSPNTGATNSSAFSAYSVISRSSYNGEYSDLGDYSIMWSATEYSNSMSNIRELDYNKEEILGGAIPKSLGFSVRCVRD